MPATLRCGDHTYMRPSQELIDELFLDKVRAARRMSPAEKFLDGPRLFDFAARIAKVGIRFRNPHASPEEVNAILLHQLSLARKWENPE